MLQSRSAYRGKAFWEILGTEFQAGFCFGSRLGYELIGSVRRVEVGEVEDSGNRDRSTTKANNADLCLPIAAGVDFSRDNQSYDQTRLTFNKGAIPDSIDQTRSNTED